MKISTSKPIAVVGGASGIGAAVVQNLSEIGAKALILDLNPPQDTAIDYIACDITDRAMFAGLSEHLPKLGGVVVTAGIEQSLQRLEDTEEEMVRHVVDVNLLGSLWAMQLLLPRVSEGGSVVLTASVAGLTGMGGNAVYASAKGAILALVRELAREYGQSDIRVNAVAPGFVVTPLLDRLLPEGPQRDLLVKKVPLRRLASPKDVADVVVFLLSRSANYISGVTLPVDGGYQAVR